MVGIALNPLPAIARVRGNVTNGGAEARRLVERGRATELPAEWLALFTTASAAQATQERREARVSLVLDMPVIRAVATEAETPPETRVALAKLIREAEKWGRLTLKPRRPLQIRPQKAA